jgi:3-methyladenine DNA glycosylase/8-oxoguanine DNA glycosylase
MGMSAGECTKAVPQTGLVPTAGAERSRTWRPDRPVAVAATLGSLQRGGGDPTYRRDRDGTVWRTSRTPEGPGTIRIVAQPTDGSIRADAWGPGAQWLLETFPASLGADDDATGFVPGHPLVRDLARRHPGWRVPRSRRVLEALVPAVLEQKVTGMQARRAWRTLLRWYGDAPPGPAPVGMRVFPSAQIWAAIPSWDWHRAGVDGKRSRTILAAVSAGARLEESLDLPHDAAQRRLRAVPGVGAWTAAEVMQRAHGWADAVSVGDFHQPSQIVYVLTGEPRADDARFLEVLEPWRGHRYRVVRLVELAGIVAPKYGPRYAPHDFRAM